MVYHVSSMQSLRTSMSTNSLTQTLSSHIVETLLQLGIPNTLIDSSVLIERPADPSHGHFAFPASMSLFGKLKKENPSVLDTLHVSNPRELAAKIAVTLEENKEIFKSVSVAGPGFVNMTLTDTFLTQNLSSLLLEEHISGPQLLQGKEILVEFTDPNPFKELHIGHLYSNVIGEAISRVLESQGAQVHRVCYQGDVGMHVAKSVWGMKKLLQQQFPEVSIMAAVDKMEEKTLSEKVNFLGKSYATGASAYKDEPASAEQMKDINYLTFLSGQENLVEQTGWEPQVDYKQYVAQTAQNYEEVKKLYTRGRAWSLAYFDSMYQRIGMKFEDFFYESVVGEFGIKIVREFLAKGVFVESEGAVIFPGEKYNLHNRVFINSLGLPTYEAKELGLAPEKYRRFKYDTSLIITGNEIDEYFKVLLKALEITNPDLRAKTVHMSHGMVRLPEGKMSSRTGKIITAEWLMDEAHSRIEKVLADTRQTFTKAERTEISEVVGLSAIKFAFLKQSIGKDIAFDFDESLAFTGNSGPYILYSLVRAKSVLAKASEAGITVKNRYSAEHIDILVNSLTQSKVALQKNEKDLLLNVLMYFDTLSQSASEYAPHHIANYLFVVAQSFNAFYSESKIIDESDAHVTELRLAITQSVVKVLMHGLSTLGIKTVEKM